MKARHPSARTGGTRSFWQFSASRGPVALRSWGEFGRAAFPSRGHLVRGHHCPRSSVAAGSGKSCPINRWITQPHPAITRHHHFADLGRHAHALGLRQCPHLPCCPRCGYSSFCHRVQHIAKSAVIGTTRHCTGGGHATIAVCAVTFSDVSDARRFND